MPEIKLKDPFKGILGGYKASALVYYMRNGRLFARGKSSSETTIRTTDQVTIRTYMTTATRAWKTITEAQRQAWEVYAAKYYTKDDDGKEITPSGLTTYGRANMIRQVLGLPLVADAPSVDLPPPMPATGIVQLGAQNPDSVGIEVNHTNASIVGLQLLVRATAATPSVANDPDKSGYRYVRGINADSALALLASGGSYTFTPSRYIVNDGQRYGVEVKIVRTADGIMSPPLYGDFIKSV